MARLTHRLAGVLGGVRGRMLLLLLIAGIPVTGIALSNALQDHATTLEEGRRALLSARTNLAVRQSAVLDAGEALLRTLARLDLSGEERCSETLRRARDLQAVPIADVRVARPDGTVICSPEGPGPERLEAPLAALAREATEGAGPVLGPILRGADLRLAALPLAVAVARPPDDALPRPVLLGTVALRDLAPTAAELPGSTSAWLLDRTGTSVALSAAATRPPVLGSANSAPAPGVRRTPDGYSVAEATLRPGLRLVVAQPAPAIEGAARTVLIQRITELTTFLLVCLVAILAGADVAMVRPLRLLSARVRAWRPGTLFSPAPIGTEPREVLEVEQAFADAAAALTRREAELQAALDQRDALMAEIHHRVKNNLQIVSSLLNLQAGRIADPAASAEFLAARNRVRALATLHRHLYVQHAFEQVLLRPFLTELANGVFNSHNESPGERITLRLDVDDVPISVDQAVTLSLFVTEAVGNAVEHAFPDSGRGTVRLEVRAEDGHAVVTIADDGIGLPDRKDRPRGLGLTLMEGFAKQLGGALQGGRGEPPALGTRWSVRFPLRPDSAPRRMGTG